MRICGVTLEGNNAILSVVEVIEGSEPTFISIPNARISLGDDKVSQHIKNFQLTMQSIVNDWNIHTFVIKTRQKKGRMQGGGDTFKMEALIQSLECESVKFISPNAIAAFIKKETPEKPDGCKAYQAGAYFAVLRHLRDVA